MKIHEFVTKSLLEEFVDRMILEGRENRDSILLSLFEHNQEQLNQATHFIALHKQDPEQHVIGQKYAPIGIIFAGNSKLLLISTSDIVLTLVSTSKDYTLSKCSKQYKFPGNNTLDSSLSATLFYNTVEESTAMIPLILLALRHNDWKLERHIIQSDSTVLKIL